MTKILSSNKEVPALPAAPFHVPDIPPVDREDLADRPALSVISAAELILGLGGAWE